MGLSLSHILLVLVAVLIVFGARRLPSVMSDLAKGLKAFKNGLKEGEGTPPTLTNKSKSENEL
jgi:sec-independent protein translocase protein TatA